MCGIVGIVSKCFANQLPYNALLALQRGAVVKVEAVATLEEGQAAYAHGDYEHTFAIFRSLAVSSYAARQVRLGIMYQVGYDYSKDKAEAVRWFRKAAEQGNADAQSALNKLGN
jgi:TPR repeat protein